MISEQHQISERLFQVLVEEIRSRRPQYLREPFTVAEIYQDLVPYRSHRDRIGAAMNGDYEHALLRLLSGEDGYLFLESDPARRRLVAELDSSNPNTGIFREYAALDVRLNPALIPPEAVGSSSRPAGDRSAAPEPAPAPPTGEGAALEGAAGWGGVRPEDEGTAAPDVPLLRRPSGSADSEPRGGSVPLVETAPHGRPTTCRWCREELPSRETLRFCPFCGTDVSLVPCPACGEEVEPGWRFCIACGAQVSGED